jgi:DNA (cytosine-5)-methyltransferase 1
VRRPKVISLFSGAGGLDYGLEKAGFDVAVALELDHDCCTTLRANTEWPVIERNIFDVSTQEMLDAGVVKAGDVDLLVGGPPCQPFSKSGYWNRGDALRLDDPRADTLSAYLRVLREALPRVFMLENVEGLVYSRKDEGLRMLLDSISRINKRTGSNYQPTFQVLNAADYGVPQIRERVFLVGARDGTPFRFPTPTHYPAPAPETGLQPHRTAWDAIGALKPSPDEDLAVKGKWARLLPSVPEGQNYLWHTERGGGQALFGWRRRYWSFLLKLAKDRPSWTIQAQPGPAVGPFHWSNRRLSMRELCRIQTFPDSVSIVGTRGSVQRQVGNAVPSLLADVLGRAIRTQLLRLPAAGPRRWLPAPPPGPIPPAERVAALPDEYRPLVGKHTAHPGTGKGFGAIARQRLKAAG